MLGISIIRKSMALVIAIAVWSVFSMPIMAASDDVMGEITVTGQVTINGQNAVSGSTVTDGSTIVTAPNSTATITIGKNNRVEILSDSTLTLKFSNNSIVGMLNSGKVRISNAAGMAATVSTRNAMVIADVGQANAFGVDVGCADEARCTHTYVETTMGLVTLRSGTTDKQVAAGTDATFGNPSQTGCKPCLRPGSVPSVAVSGLSTGVVAAILLAVAGGVAAAILLNNDNDIELGSGAIVASTIR